MIQNNFEKFFKKFVKKLKIFDENQNNGFIIVKPKIFFNFKINQIDVK